MRNIITKTVSMMLVTVMVLGIFAMPFRISAGQAEIADMASPALEQIAKLNNALTSDDEEAKQSLKALFPIYDSDIPVASVSISDLEGLAKTLSRNGISAVFDAKYNAEYSQEIWYLTCESIDSFPVSIYGQYAPGGRYVVAVPDGSSSAEQSTDKFSGQSKTEIKQVFDNSTNTWIDVEVTDIDQSTTNNSVSVDFKTGTFYDVNGGTLNVFDKLVYNPVTQTYDVTFTDNRHYTYQFYYDYTYITYIGSSAEYREAYKVYYELPDGRSSGDLTADELKGLSLQFDMVNYDKVDTDTLTTVLLSFDGNLDNTAYQSDPSTGTVSTFLRNSGYSFLESPEPFGGSLFVPITNSTFTNPFSCGGFRSLGKGSSFTLQGRFYLDGTWSASASDSLDKQFAFCVQYASYWFSIFRVYGDTLRCDALRGPYTGEFTTKVASGVWYSFCFVYDGDLDRAAFWLNEDACIPSEGSLFTSAPDTVAVTQSNLENLQQPTWPSSGTSRFVNMDINGIGFFNGNSSAPVRVDNVRLVAHPLYTTTKIKVPQAPFDTNLVYVLPSVADLNDNTVAIMSLLPVSGYRVGGIRPTDPTLASGYVYMHIDGEYIDSVQQWNGAYWEEVTARLYTGIRWIPVTAFNVFTLEDMFDIIDPDADGSGDNVDDIYKYYLWWSGEWGSFQQWLQGTMQTLIEAIQASGGGGGGSDAPVVIVPGYNDQTTTSEITTENPDGSTTKTTIVSNAAGLVYSNSVTTYPTDVNGNTKTITVYTDSSGVMYQTETIIDKDGNVTVTEPTKATGTLGSILKMITNGVMSIAGTVIEGFVTIVVDGVKFIIESADSLIDGVGNMITSLASSITDFAGTVQDNLDQPGVNPSVDEDDDEQGDGDGGQTYNMFDVFFEVLPPEIVTALTLCFVAMIALPIINKMHF